MTDLGALCPPCFLSDYFAWRDWKPLPRSELELDVTMQNAASGRFVMSLGTIPVCNLTAIGQLGHMIEDNEAISGAQHGRSALDDSLSATSDDGPRKSQSMVANSSCYLEYSCSH